MLDVSIPLSFSVSVLDTSISLSHCICVLAESYGVVGTIVIDDTSMLTMLFSCDYA